MRIIVRIIGGSSNANSNRKENLMKSVVMLVESRQKIKKEAKQLHEKIETFENLKQKDEVEKLIKADMELQSKYFSNIQRENMLLNMATSTNFNFKFN